MQITKKRKERECSQESLLANREFQVQCTKPRKSGEQTKFMKTIIMIQKLFHKILECRNTGVLPDVSTVSQLRNCGLVLENGISYNLNTTLSQSECEFQEGSKVKICEYLNFPTRTSLSVVTSKRVKTFLPIFLNRQKFTERVARTNNEVSAYETKVMAQFTGQRLISSITLMLSL